MLREIAVYAKANKYANVHPVEKMLLCILPILIMGFVEGWSIVIINIVCFIAMHYVAKTPYKRVIKMISGILVFYLISSVVLVFDKGIYFSILIILRGLSASLCLAFFIFTTPFDYLLHYFSKFEGLRDICDISKATERFFMLLEEEGNQIVMAMKSRGGFRGIKGRINDVIRVMILSFHNSTMRWQISREVLAARSYRGRYYYGLAPYSYSRRRIVGVLTYNSVLIVIMGLSKF